jgi:uncharacterized protein YggU (UPF0235/DUF167 family)
MEIKIVVKAGAAHSKVDLVDNKMVVATKAKAKGNMANEAVREILAKHYNINLQDVKIIKGHKSKNKLVEVNI